MDDASKPARLLEWAIGTFHTIVFFLALVLSGYWAGALGTALGSLNTIIGTGIFVLFWFVMWWTGRRALSGVIQGIVERYTLSGRVWGLVVRGFIWGAIDGMVVFAAIFLVFILILVLPDVLQSPPGAIPSDVVVLLIYGGIGLVIAFIAGSAIGLVFTLLDLIVLGLARLVLAAIVAEPKTA